MTDDPEFGGSASEVEPERTEEPLSQEPSQDEPQERFVSDADYFDSYADPGVHRLMIADHARTDAYRRALEEVVTPGMRVLDVGTGTGILSLFSARAGAAEVIGVDLSSIVETAQVLARQNGLGERVRFERDRAEDVEIDGKVDLIVSEWMGFFALAECMFTSVLVARDKHLATDGVMMPSHTRLFFAPIEDEAMHIDRGTGLWEKPVYGFDFSALIEHEVHELITTAADLKADSLLGPETLLCELDCKTAANEDFFFETTVTLPIERDGTLHGFGGWFEVDLSPSVVLSTSPKCPSTHWRQSYFPVRPFDVRAGDEIRLKMWAMPREYGDKRLPLYFMDGWLIRRRDEVHRFFYSHAASFE